MATEPTNRALEGWEKSQSEGDPCCVEKCRRPARMTEAGTYCRWHWRVLPCCVTAGCEMPAHNGSRLCRLCLVGDGDKEQEKTRREDMHRKFSPIALMELFSK